jgi:4'-phosphopantetheinyl transferase
MSPTVVRVDGQDEASRRVGPVAVLPSGEVRLWLAHLDADGWRSEDLVRTLSPDELRRAEAFAYARERRRFVVARGILRQLLARYLCVDPVAVDLVYGPNGKPELRHDDRAAALNFSVSHSEALALYAVAADRRVGVDLERVRPLPEAATITQLCFSPRERATLAELTGDELETVVLRGWTLKEAYLKATGEGLTLPPERVEVILAPDAPPQLLAVGGDAQAAACWSLSTFAPAAGYTAALAAEQVVDQDGPHPSRR